MPKVAIIGCSFSDVAYAEYTWSFKLPKLYPNIRFYNYAKGGMGSLYQDMCLKHVLYVEHYDYIIVQCTSGLRWHVPETTSFVKGKAVDVNPYDAFHEQQIDDNQTRMLLNETVQQLITLENPSQDEEEDTTFKKKPFRTSYHGLYLKQLEAFSKIYPISYFSFPDLKFIENNIGQQYDVWSWLEHNYDPIDVDNNMLDDTNHLNDYGNDELLNKYILQSNVKDYLTSLK